MNSRLDTKILIANVTFQFYEFSAEIPSETSITSFTVSITNGDGTVVTYDNNGSSFPVQDSVALQTSQSCVSDNKIKVIAAVDILRAGRAISVSTTVQQPRQGAIAPSLVTFSTPMTLSESYCDFLFYTAEIPISSGQAATAKFDVISGEGDDVVTDAFKAAKSLPTCA